MKRVLIIVPFLLALGFFIPVCVNMVKQDSVWRAEHEMNERKLNAVAWAQQNFIFVKNEKSGVCIMMIEVIPHEEVDWKPIDCNWVPEHLFITIR